MSPRGTGSFMDGLLGMAKSSAAGKEVLNGMGWDPKLCAGGTCGLRAEFVKGRKLVVATHICRMCLCGLQLNAILQLNYGSQWSRDIWDISA